MRFKIYNKTADKLTSNGVSNNSTEDPFSNLVLAGERNKKIVNDRDLSNY